MNTSREVRFGDRLRLRLPADVATGDQQSIDSDATVWTGSGVTVVVDEGPYADTLTSYRDKPDQGVTEAAIGGRPARVVSFDREDGGHYAAAHFPADEDRAGGLTVAVEASPEVSRDVSTSILQSITFP